MHYPFLTVDFDTDWQKAIIGDGGKTAPTAPAMVVDVMLVFSSICP